MKFTFAGIDIGVTAKFVKEVYGFPFDRNEKNKDYHNEFKIKLLRNGIEKTFPYYDSTSAWHDKKTELTTSDLKNALECILSDTISSYDTFEDFCSEMGYDTDSKTAEQIYKTILKHAKKVEEMGFTRDELYAVLNDIHESE